MILIIDDDIGIRTSLNLLIKQAGLSAFAASNPNDAIDWLRKNSPELIIMDMNFSIKTTGDEGLELLQKVKIFHPNVPVILITGWGTIELAVQGVKLGASDFITKPWDNRAILESIKTNIKVAQINNEDCLKNENELRKQYVLDNIVGNSKELTEVLSSAMRIAKTNATVLVTGESGTGKELIAEAIHNNSNRKDKPFVKVNLGGVSTSLFESEMFGHKRGAFTDAHTDRIGRFQMADGGTIFLDEIGELDLQCQVKLLRVLQEQTFEVLGSSEQKRVDVRVVCATNRNLPLMVRKGKFREDLYYRINLINLNLPALRERVTDIPLLVKHFSEMLCKEHNLPIVDISKAAFQHLKKQPFRGNIRELKNLVERTLLLATSSEIDVEDFQQNQSAENIGDHSFISLISINEMEHQMILKTLESYKNNIAGAARSLGLSRGALYRRLDKYNIKYEVES